MVNDDWVSDYCFNCRFTHSEKISPVVGMTLIPCIGAMILGYSVGDLVKFFDKGLSQVMNVVIMFIFAIIFLAL